MDKNLRKLASIQKIDDVKLIKDADRIEVAKVGGWNVVVKKDEFKKDDLCVYCEIDCLMPEKPEFEFLRAKHFRIKTQKMRGVISQGIAFPLSILPTEMYEDIKKYNRYDKIIGTEVTEQIGIKKYEPPISPQLMGMVRGNFPTHIIPKTDEERCIHQDTIIQTEDGQKTIKEICELKYFGKVLCKDNKNSIVYSKIIDHSISESNDDWYEIELENGYKLKCTGNHLIYIPDLMTYIRVDELNGNEKLLII